MSVGSSLEARISKSLAAYPLDVQRAADEWRGASYLQWVDAVAWIASKNASLMKLLTSHRLLMARGVPNPDFRRAKDSSGNVEGDDWHNRPAWIVSPRSAKEINAECAIITREHILDGEKLDAAGESLRKALEAGKVSGIGIASDGSPGEVASSAWALGFAYVPSYTGDAVLVTSGGKLLYSHLQVGGSSFFAVWPDNDQPKPQRGRKPSYDWASFEAEAYGRLTYNGGFMAGDYQQSQLEEEMAAWCLKKWSRTPGESLIREHVVKVRDRYEQAEAGN